MNCSLRRCVCVALLGAIAIATRAHAQRVPPLGTKVRVEVPRFTAPEDALAWAKNQLTAAKQGKADTDLLFMKSASAAKLAQDWRDATQEVRLEAALAGAEALLALRAPLNALAVTAQVRVQDLAHSVFGPALFERAAEATELRGDRKSALVGYERGLAGTPSPAWQILLSYRAAMVSLELGHWNRAATHLEAGLGLGAHEGPRETAMMVALGRAYLGLKDRTRAEAWLHKASANLTHPGAAAGDDVGSFIPEPSTADLQREINDIEKGLKDLP